MKPQFTYDISGNPIGVFLPIEDWNNLKSKYQDLENDDLPQWQKDILDRRMELLTLHPEQVTTFDDFMKEMEEIVK